MALKESLLYQETHKLILVEKAHQIIGNIIHTSKVQHMVLENENPWDGI